MMAMICRRGPMRFAIANSANHPVAVFSTASSKDVTFSIDQFVVSAPVKQFTLKQGIRLAQRFATAKFDESIDLSLKLGVDPRKPNQQVRGMALLPHGIGKRPIVAVFARHEHAEEARAAGADIVGADDLLQRVQAGDIPFTKCIATPEMMPLIGRIARILGPRGLMPNPKMGTLTEDVSSAVSAAFKGQVEFKAGHLGCLNAGIGRASFSEQQLVDNARAFIKALQRARPASASSRYFIGAHISSTMGKSFELDTMQWPFGNA